MSPPSPQLAAGGTCVILKITAQIACTMGPDCAYEGNDYHAAVSVRCGSSLIQCPFRGCFG